MLLRPRSSVYFCLACQLPSEKERFHVFVCRVTFVCHCFAMCTFAAISLSWLLLLLAALMKIMLGIHLASLCLSHCICATNGQKRLCKQRTVGSFRCLSCIFNALSCAIALVLFLSKNEISTFSRFADWVCVVLYVCLFVLFFLAHIFGRWCSRGNDRFALN